LKRWVQDQKFKATLPQKIDNSVEEYLAAIEEAQQKEWEYWEKLDGDTPLGGEMRLTHKSNNHTTSEKNH